MAQTFFAPAKRAGKDEIERYVEFVTGSAVVDGILQMSAGLLAILNEQRQVIAVNKKLLDWLGISDSEELPGLRPGEIFHCVHADAPPNGCGTTRFCKTCGLAISIVAALTGDEPCERYCSLEVSRDGWKQDVFLAVHGQSMTIDGHRLLLLLIQDETEAQRKAMMERVFLHDLANLLAVLSLQVEMIASKDPQGPQGRALEGLVEELKREVRLHAVIAEGSLAEYEIRIEKLDVAQVFNDLAVLFRRHPAAAGKRIEIQDPPPDGDFESDKTLAYRVLGNMIINALEAGEEGDEVRVWADVSDDTVSMHVWNRQTIPPETALRVFQRNFSTKTATGRGLGSYAMRLIGEGALAGRVSFESTPEIGTVFTFTLPAMRSDQ